MRHNLLAYISVQFGTAINSIKFPEPLKLHSFIIRLTGLKNLARITVLKARYIKPFRFLPGHEVGKFGLYKRSLYEAVLNSLWTFNFPLAVFQKLCLVPA